MQRVLAAAEHVLTEGGLDKFTTARVAEEAGVSAAAVYRRFAGKKELLAAVQADLQNRIDAAIAGALQNPGTSLGDVLHAFTTALGEVLADSGQVIPALLGSRTGGTPIHGLPITNTLRQQFLNATIEHRADIRRRNPIAALNLALQTMIAAAAYRAIATLQSPDGLNWQQWATEIADMATTYLQTDKRSSQSRGSPRSL